MSFSRFLAVLASGALFGFGLALSTMVSPEVVLGFLRFQDYGLMLVMGGAVCVTLLVYQLAPRLLGRPLLEEQFAIRPSLMDRDTLLGAAIFGLGWGVCGVCPGPAIAGLGTGNWDLLIALAGIAAGAYLQGWLKDSR
ncbi:MAG TPA: YeeE/YedE thiosulfate transporter family protein [Rhodoferax sp.]|jgi:hypothetical protein|nr:DUF6691 family protein [Rhodoferax sp.]HNV59401.1 YeeE/YedE thiosulfate transporter family protein [Rhodoferax sp.]HPW28597.1 YeeE/YedE thiosulfate transporter family protein [Rhodoferax sp.]